ncbi:hypothetical protein JB92DRAFT_2049863 [Gautieria morchelliformis]|nr:hypothetical protein JB92DRAFT_2049863 [Gautieria morchelliformis]
MRESPCMQPSCAQCPQILTAVRDVLVCFGGSCSPPHPRGCVLFPCPVCPAPVDLSILFLISNGGCCRPSDSPTHHPNPWDAAGAAPHPACRP